MPHLFMEMPSNPGFPPINRFEGNTPLEIPERIKELNHMRSGDVRYGYAACREPFLTAITGPGRASVFIYRDPTACMNITIMS